MGFGEKTAGPPGLTFQSRRWILITPGEQVAFGGQRCCHVPALRGLRFGGEGMRWDGKDSHQDL